MGVNPRQIGDEHVKLVHQALLLFLSNQSIENYPNTVIETVLYITKLYPNINTATSKFDSKHPDQEKDLTLNLENQNTVTINLFVIKKNARIQPKNPGAKSFFTKYFLSESLQEMFNEEFERDYLEFLKGIVAFKIGTHYLSDKRELKHKVSFYYPRFTNEINPFRDYFLYSLRETCFTLLKDFFNNKNEGFFHAYNAFFMTEDVNIITRYGTKIDDVSVEEFNPGMPNFNDIQIYKVGKNTVGIKYGQVALTLRFKFESGPTSSIKLAACYDIFPDESEKAKQNENTIQKMDDLIASHLYIETSNSSNAIGKCHEAISYYYFLKDNTDISQVEPNECVELLNKYYASVKPAILEKLYRSTSTIVPVVMRKLDEKYSTYTIESVELVPESYISDKLDTGDLQLVLRVNNDYVVENISLKAISKKGGKITTKNPGIGTILGPTYFNIGNLDQVINEVKSKFQIGEFTHKESLEVLAEELGLQLKGASQQQLKQGIENLLGKAMMAVTFYDENESYCKEHSKINSTITVHVQKPTAIQNTLAWCDEKEAINLRVKFSKGQSHGWSSVKLTSEYQLK